MCGRYNIKTTGAEIADAFDAQWSETYAPSYNIAPTTEQPVLLVDRNGQRSLRLFRWGLVPFWADDPRVGARMINARSETVADKPAFRAAFRKRRCVVPATGFYEWKSRDDGKKQPYNIVPTDDDYFAFAGLWEHWNPGGDADRESVWSYTILTCAANEALQPLHDRMPVILQRGEIDRWLGADADRHRSDLDALLSPAPAAQVRYFPVSSAVGNVRNNDRTLTEPLPQADADAEPQPTLDLGKP